jgi:hypothetical protein
MNKTEVEYIPGTSVEEMMESHARHDLARKTLEKLLLELSIRANNQHVGSCIGGNASEWWFLVNHKVKLGLSRTELSLFSKSSDPDEVIFSVPKKPDMKQIRGALTVFFASHPDRLDTTEEQLVNLSFLRDQPIRSTNAKIYLHAVKAGLELAHWLDVKIELDNEISKVISKEQEVFRASFLKEMDLPTTYFEDCDNDDPFEAMYYKHPVWGVKDAASSKRHSLMFAQLLSQDDLDKMTFIGSCPSFITMPAFRRLVQIERMVRLNLDERPECDFLSRINSIIDEGEESVDE